MCFGSFEGRHYIHIEHDPDYLAWLEANKTAARPDGERIQDFVTAAVPPLPNWWKKALRSTNSSW